MKKKQLKQSIVYCGICMLVALHSIQGRAQFSIGVQGGYNKNYLVTNVSNLVSTQYNPMGGFSLGIPMLYTLTDWFAIKSAPGYTQKNSQMQRTGFYQGVYQNNTNGYLQLPLMAHLSFGGETLRGYVDAGGYAGYWLSAHVKGTMPNILNPPAYTGLTSNQQPNNVFDEYTPYSYDEKYQFNTTKDNRIEFGLAAGAGVSYKLSDTYQVFGEATYCESLTDQQKKYETGQVPRYNQTYVFSLGLLYTISRKDY